MALSPMMKQYFDIKNEYADALLFFRLGDFYEMFFDDAKIASEELDLVLTGRDCGQDEKALMCGVPFHSADNYIARLINKGYKVAICEQMEDPKSVKGLVKRDVIRVITPGTVIENNLLEDSINNYLCSICKGETETGLCFADISTSEFHITTVANGDGAENQIIDQLSVYQPKEILINSAALDYGRLAQFVKSSLNTELQLLDDDKFEFEAAANLIMETLNKDEIGSLELGHSKAAVSSLGAVIDYLKDVQKKDEIEAPSEIDFFDNEQYMKLDINARRNLELTKSMMTGERRHSLLWVIDKTKTAMGKRMMRNWLERPLMSIPMITKRQNAVCELADSPQKRDKIRACLSGINDIERLMTRIAYGTANAKELKSLEATIDKLPEIKEEVQGFSSSLLKSIENDIDLLLDVKELIENSITDEPPFTVREGGMIKAGYNEEIDSLKAIMEDGAGIIASIEAGEREKTGIPKLKIGYNRVFGYYIEVTNSYKDLVPEEYIRKQTLANCERYITQELKELEGKILGAKDREIALEYELFCQIRNIIANEIGRFHKTARALSMLDVLSGLAEVAVTNNYVCPTINNNGVIEIKDGRHPVVEALLDGAPFVPNDIILDKGENRCSIITETIWRVNQHICVRSRSLFSLLKSARLFLQGRQASALWTLYLHA